MWTKLLLEQTSSGIVSMTREVITWGGIIHMYSKIKLMGRCFLQTLCSREKVKVNVIKNGGHF